MKSMSFISPDKFLKIPDLVIPAIEEVADFAAQEALKDFYKTQETFKKKFKFQIKKIDVGGRFIYTGSDIYRFISRGTRVRYAVMSRNWISKTKPGRWHSTPGRGHVVIISRKIARPGIKARGFEKIVANRLRFKTKRIVKRIFWPQIK